MRFRVKPYLVQLMMIFFAIVCGSMKAMAFPDMMRHGYANCSTCHASPAGGGLLNSYGRSLSGELLSTWKSKNEEQPLHGAVSISDFVMEKYFFGGDVRYLSRRTKDPRKKVDEGFLMQTQLRFGLALEKLKFLMSIGKIENPRQSQEVKWVSSEYYFIWNVKEEVYLRAGRFEPIFGLRMPDHNLWVKSDVSLVPWLERDTIELMVEGEKLFLSLAGFQSTSKVATVQQATGYAATASWIWNEKLRFGSSAMNSEGQGNRTKALSFHNTYAFSTKAYSHFEFTRVWNNDSIKEVGFFRVGREIVKGFTPLLQAQARLLHKPSASNQWKQGAGIIWLPRPHFEIMAVYEEMHYKREDSSELNLLFHYYL